jgi:hypothetical protein
MVHPPIPSGKLLHSELENHHFNGKNSLFLLPCSIAKCWHHQRVQCEAPKIAKLVHITPITMVYGTYNEIVTGANLNQHSHHWGPHIVVGEIITITGRTSSMNQLQFLGPSGCAQTSGPGHWSPPQKLLGSTESAAPAESMVFVAGFSLLGDIPQRSFHSAIAQWPDDRGITYLNINIYISILYLIYIYYIYYI